jgi:hypothetical protein
MVFEIINEYRQGNAKVYSLKGINRGKNEKWKKNRNDD